MTITATTRGCAAAAFAVALLTTSCTSQRQEVEDLPRVQGREDSAERGGEREVTEPGDVVERTIARAGPVADAVFLTAVDEVIGGTVYDGLVDAIPGEFLLTATLVCERLDGGQDRLEVLRFYLWTLGAGEPSQEDAQLAGALVGAGIEVYCPEHAQ